ncbi:MAG: alanine--tRNA ligase-related protein, partial [Chitinophagaceae bacterium]
CEEEEAFLRTLEKGLKRIEDIFAASNKTVSGKDAFELYDTYGFPLDLTRLIASEKAFTIDEEGFTAEMQKQKDRSRAATATDAGDWIVVHEELAPVEFVGYNLLQSAAKILRYRSIKQKGKETFQLVLDRTPFYAESGGQVGDTGQLIINNETVKIIDTKKENDLVVHFAEKLPKDLTGEGVAKVDAQKRSQTALHHSATHLLHAALRKVLGTHVTQKGSLVAPGYLRFDFAHFSKVTPEEIAEIEKLVNEKIRLNIPVSIQQMSKDEAMQSGAMALFGEKYGDTVRVVTMDPTYSVELCGGTHVGATGELGLFKITTETAVAAGVRRIEAVCGQAAEAFIDEQLQQLQQVKEALKNPKDISKAIQSLQDETVALRKSLERFEAAQLKSIKEALLQKVETVNGISFIGAVTEVGSADALKKLAFDLKGSLTNYAVVLAAAVDGKAQVVVLYDEALVTAKNLDAGATIKQKIAPLIKGGGGGQKSLATAGGQNAADLQAVIEAVKNGL